MSKEHDWHKNVGYWTMSPGVENMCIGTISTFVSRLIRSTILNNSFITQDEVFVFYYSTS